MPLTPCPECGRTLIDADNVIGGVCRSCFPSLPAEQREAASRRFFKPPKTGASRKQAPSTPSYHGTSEDRA